MLPGGSGDNRVVADGMRCERCGAIWEAGRWCPECGLDREPGGPTLPTPEARAAADRELVWLAGHPEAAIRAARPANVKPYQPLGNRARWAVGLLWASLVTDTLVGFLDLVYLAALADEPDDAPLAVVAEDPAYIALGLGYLARLGVLVAAAIAFLLWFHRAYANLPALGVWRPRYGTGWAVGSWFIPIFSWFRPKQYANDLWRAGDERGPTKWGTVDDLPVSDLVHWWWIVWLVAGVVGNIDGQLTWNAATVAEDQTAAEVDVVASVLYVICALLAIQVVQRTTERLQNRNAAVRSVGPEAPHAAVPG